MKAGVRLLLAAACAVGPGGCGTSRNLNDPLAPPAVYGGVRRDASLELVADYSRSSPAGATPLATVPLVALSLADLPLSAVCDTLTLPITIRAALKKQPEQGADAPAPVRAAAPDAPSAGEPPSAQEPNVPLPALGFHIAAPARWRLFPAHSAPTGPAGTPARDD